MNNGESNSSSPQGTKRQYTRSSKITAMLGFGFGLSLGIIVSQLFFNTSVSSYLGNFTQSPLYYQEIEPKPGEKRTLHIVQCVYGNKPHFIDEWEVSFKSVLNNAPLDSHMHIHIIANKDGADAVENVIKEAELPDSFWRNQINITITNMESNESYIWSRLSHALVTANNTTSSLAIDRRLGLGAFLRLFAYEIIMRYVDVSTSIAKQDLRQAVYLDVDVVILANLNNLIWELDNMFSETEHFENYIRPVVVWGSKNTGFLVMDLIDFDKLWAAIDATESIKQDPWPKKNDQWILQHVYAKQADLFMDLPQASSWNYHIGHGFRNAPQRLVEPPHVAAAMLHLQNSEVGNWFLERKEEFYVDHFCDRGKGCRAPGDKEKVRNSWGLADYYVRMSWDWTRFQGGKSRISLDKNVKKYNLRLQRYIWKREDLNGRDGR